MGPRARLGWRYRTANHGYVSQLAPRETPPTAKRAALRRTPLLALTLASVYRATPSVNRTA